MQKVFHITTRLDQNTKTEDTHIVRLSGDEYDFGCSPVAEVEAVTVLEYEGKYPQI